MERVVDRMLNGSQSFDRLNEEEQHQSIVVRTCHSRTPIRGTWPGAHPATEAIRHHSCVPTPTSRVRSVAESRIRLELYVRTPKIDHGQGAFCCT